MRLFLFKYGGEDDLWLKGQYWDWEDDRRVELITNNIRPIYLIFEVALHELIHYILCRLFNSKITAKYQKIQVFGDVIPLKVSYQQLANDAFDDAVKKLDFTKFVRLVMNGRHICALCWESKLPKPYRGLEFHSFLQLKYHVQEFHKADFSKYFNEYMYDIQYFMCEEDVLKRCIPA